jgi:hypothetical protein
MNAKYSLVPRKIWQRKPGFTGCPAQVSIHGALPSPREAYEMAEKGYSIYDSRSNTYSNYFFGKIGILTKEEGMAIISRLNK